MKRLSPAEIETLLVDTFASPLSLHQRDLVVILIDNGPCTARDIVRLFYGDKAEPSPERLTVVRIMVSRIRKVLEPFGWTVARGSGGKTKGGVPAPALYDLQRVKRRHVRRRK